MGKSSYYVFFDKSGKVLGHSEDLYRGKQFAKLEDTELEEVLDVANDALEHNLLRNVMVHVPVWGNIPALFGYGRSTFEDQVCNFIPSSYWHIADELESEELSIPLREVSIGALSSHLGPSERLYIDDRLEEYCKRTAKFNVLISTGTSKRLMVMGRTLWKGVAFLKKAAKMVSSMETELSHKQWLSLSVDYVLWEWHKIDPCYEWFLDSSWEPREKWDEVPVFCEELYNNIARRISEMKGMHE